MQKKNRIDASMIMGVSLSLRELVKMVMLVAISELSRLVLVLLGNTLEPLITPYKLDPHILQLNME